MNIIPQKLHTMAHYYSSCIVNFVFISGYWRYTLVRMLSLFPGPAQLSVTIRMYSLVPRPSVVCVPY